MMKTRLLTTFLTLLLMSLPLAVEANTEIIKGRLALPSESPGLKCKENIFLADGISDFILVDAETNTDLFTLKEAGVIDIAQFGDRRLNIRVNPLLPDIFVDFTLSGPINRTWTEMVAPFALFGDINGNYNGVKLPAGTYFLQAASTLFGGHLNTIEINFTVGEDTNAVISFSLIDAGNDVDLDSFSKEYHINDGQQFAIDDYPMAIGINPNRISIKSSTNSYATGSVLLSLSGPISFSRTENVEPYTLFGDLNGDFNGRIFPAGTYKLSATPYSEPNGNGMEGVGLTISFSIGVQDNYFLNGAMLIDAETLDFLDEILSADDGNITDVNLVRNATVVIEYDCISGPCPESVHIVLNGPVNSSRIENVEPFTLFGDSNGNFMGQTLPLGEYTLTFTPYSADNGMGIPGRTTSADFRIIDDSFFEKGPDAILYPNPARDITVLKTAGKNKITGNAIIFDFLGREVKRDLNLVQGSEKSIDLSGLAKGLYFMKIQVGNEIITKRLVVH